MLVPFRRVVQQATSQEESFRCLRRVKFLNQPFAECVMGSLAHPTPTEVCIFLSGDASIQKKEKKHDSHITITGECKEKPTRHDVACDNVSRPI
jgi:hypothetical protein